jgi:signal transduction histidine kinase
MTKDREEKVGRLEKELADAKARAATKEKILRTYAHDIRTNLGGIQGLAEIISMDAETKRNADGNYTLSEEDFGYIREIAKTAAESIKMSQNYLDLARIENGTYQLRAEHFNFVGTIHEAVRDATSDKSKDVGVEYMTLEKRAIQDFSKFEGEKTKIKTAVQNLVRNAYEAAPNGTKLGIYLGSEEDKIIVMISNKGTIPLELRDPEKLFSLGTTSGKAQGNGIGTYTARMFAKAHGGDIFFHTDDNSNSTQFTISLPLKNSIDQ